MAGISTVSLSMPVQNIAFSKKTDIPFNPGKADAEAQDRSRQIRALLRELNRTPSQNSHTGTIKAKEKGYLELSSTSESKRKEGRPKNKYHYNFKEVATRILRAKTSIGAGQAVLSAKRKVAEVKRRISSSDGDQEELQFALTHAKRMELVARRKKHHLELEEMAEHTRERDEEAGNKETASSALKGILTDTVEERTNESEDELFSESDRLMEEAGNEGLSEELQTELTEALSELQDAEFEQLEEVLALAEELEAFDPHMSEEELEELKRKHRNSESKAITKANMDYLRAFIKHQLEQGSSGPGFGSNSSAGGIPGVFFASADASAASYAGCAAYVDLQV